MRCGGSGSGSGWGTREGRRSRELISQGNGRWRTHDAGPEHSRRTDGRSVPTEYHRISHFGFHGRIIPGDLHFLGGRFNALEPSGNVTNFKPSTRQQLASAASGQICNALAHEARNEYGEPEVLNHIDHLHEPTDCQIRFDWSELDRAPPHLSQRSLAINLSTSVLNARKHCDCLLESTVLPRRI
jgi:hypothetical protein